MSRKRKPLIDSARLRINPVEYRGIKIQSIVPKSQRQREVFDAYRDEKNLLLTGCAGTGKTFILLALMLETLFTDNRFKNLLVVRSSVPTREIGYLPGTLEEKIGPYEAPYKRLLCEITGSNQAAYKLSKEIRFLSTSFIRGITLENCLILVDEASNMNFHELDSIITRVGMNCKIFFSGDESQSDLLSQFERKGYKDFMNILKDMNSFEIVRFGVEDIVRSDLVKEYLRSKEQY